MSVTGPCQICGTNPARHRCSNCGSLVCDDDFEAALGLCVDCAGPGGGRQL